MSNETTLSIHETMIVHRQARLDDIIGHETLVVCGSPRGMTSVVSYTLYNMGYFIGETLGPENHEDLDFMEAIPDPSLQKHPLKDGSLPNLIEKRNIAHERWGFKLPRAAFHVEALNALLRNPIFIVCVRNPVGVAKSVITREKGKIYKLQQLMSIAKIPYKAIDDGLAKTEAPLIIIDMDQVRRNPVSFVNELGAILHFQGDYSQIIDDISQSGYKRSKPRKGIKFLNLSEYQKIKVTTHPHHL